MVVPHHTAFQADGLYMKDVLDARKPWYHYGYLVRLNTLLLSALLTQMTNGYDGSMLNGLQSLPQWTSYFNHPAGSRLGVMSNGTVFGSVLGLLVSAKVCERFGRRRPVLYGSAVIILGSSCRARRRTTQCLSLGAL